MHSHFSHSDPITLFGAIFVAAMIAYWWLARRNASSIGIHGSHIDLLIPLSMVAGIAGGTLLSLNMPEDQLLAGEALAVDVRIRLFGMVISGAVAVFIYSRLNRQSYRSLLDVLALPLIVGLAVHRIGCFYAGCCWGDVAVQDGWFETLSTTDVGVQMQTLPWLAGEWIVTAVTYGPGTYPFEQQLAVGLIGADAVESLPVHPVQLYEAAVLLLAFLLLRRVPLDRHAPGMVAAGVALTYAVIRFAIEYLRADGALAFANLTITQLHCIGLLVITLSATGLALRFSRPDGVFQ